MTRVRPRSAPRRTLRTVPPLALLTVAALLTGPAVPAAGAAGPQPSLPGGVAADLDPAERRVLTAAGPRRGEPSRQVSVTTRAGGTLRIGTLDVAAGDAADVARLLRDQPSVAAAGLVHPVRAAADPLRPRQWPLDRLHAEQVRTLAAVAGTVVAVVDTGVDAGHPDLDDVTVPGVDLVDGGAGGVDPNGHGSHVAGIVGAEAGNGVGTEGLLDGVALMPVRVLDAGGAGSTADVARGVVWAVDHGADVVNLSLGSPGDDPSLRAAVEFAEDAGVLVLAAMGNEGAAGSPTSYPAAYPSVLAVAATDAGDARAPFSSTGAHAGLAAPGADVLSTVPGGWGTMSGTSMATPYAAAVGAAVRAAAPALTPAQVRQQLRDTAQDLGPAGPDPGFGHGLVDPVRALSTLPHPPAGAPATLPAAPAAVRAAPGDRRLTVAWDAPADGAPVTGYRVGVAAGGSTVQAVEVPASARSVVVSGLGNGVGHVASVRARGEAGLGPATAAASATPRTVPGAPALTRVVPRDRAATVTWSAPGSTGGAAVTGYQVVLSRTGSPTRTLQVAATARSVTATGLGNGSRYSVRVHARNAAGPGAASASLAVVPRTVPGAPLRPAVRTGWTSDRHTSVGVSWTAPASTGGSAVTGYTVRVHRVGSSQTVVRSAGYRSRSLTVTGLVRGARYTASVQARNAAGTGPASTRTGAATAR